MNRECSELFGIPAEQRDLVEIRGWRSIKLSDVFVEFVRPEASNKLQQISIPSLELGPSDRIGIVGPSGSGKSTILGVILGLLPFRGSYSIDGSSMTNRELAPTSVGVVASSDPIFNVSIRENILLGRKVSEARFHEVLSGVAAQDFADKLDQQIGFSGVHLSSGQEQRIKLARALLLPAELYLLDEPFAGIDRETVEKIIDFILQETAGKAVILATHREEELRVVQQVYKLVAESDVTILRHATKAPRL